MGRWGDGTNNTSLGVGIIGLGVMGRLHAENILAGKIENMTLKALCDADPARMDCFDAPGMKKYADYRRLIASGDVDAVIIATPHYDHTSTGVAALEAGLHVLVEKPISVHKADCERLIAACRGGGQVFAAMFQQRTKAVYRKLKDLIDRGELGKINRINWIITDWFRTEAYYAMSRWRATWAGEGGGVLLNQSPHQLDLWQWMFGMPDRVRAFCHLGKYHDIEVEDEVTAYLEYDNGATGVFITGTGEAPGTNRLEIAAEQGRVIVETDGISFKRNRVRCSEFAKTAKEAFGSPEVWNVEIPVTEQRGEHNAVLRNFADAVLNGAELIAPAEEGIRSVELGNAMLYSSELGRPVELPLDGAAFEEMLKKKIASSRFVKKPAGGSLPAAEDFARSF